MAHPADHPESRTSTLTGHGGAGLLRNAPSPRRPPRRCEAALASSSRVSASGRGGRALATWHPKLKRVAGTLAPRLIAPRRPPRRRRGRSRERDKTAGRHRSTHTSRATHRFYQPHRSSSRPSRARRSRWRWRAATRSRTSRRRSRTRRAFLRISSD